MTVLGSEEQAPKTHIPQGVFIGTKRYPDGTTDLSQAAYRGDPKDIGSAVIATRERDSDARKEWRKRLKNEQPGSVAVVHASLLLGLSVNWQQKEEELDKGIQNNPLIEERIKKLDMQVRILLETSAPFYLERLDERIKSSQTPAGRTDAEQDLLDALYSPEEYRNISSYEMGKKLNESITKWQEEFISGSQNPDLEFKIKCAKELLLRLYNEASRAPKT